MIEMMDKTLLIRADTGKHIGTGHVMRCLALAQAWQDRGGHAIFAMATEVPALEARLRSEGMEIVHLSTKPGSVDDARQTADLAQHREAVWIIVDGYHFDAEYQRIIKDAGLHLLFIDDYGHAAYYRADIVLNQNIHAHEGLYLNRAPYTQLLLGTRYVLLRREFLKWRGWERKIPKVARKVLITMGGVDSENVTLKVIGALEQVHIDELEAVVVVGGGNPHSEALESAIRNLRVSIRLERNVKNMPELMTWADLAISGGGTTCWELAFMGVPNLIVILAENQRPIAEGLDRAGVAVNSGWYTDLSSAEITRTLTHLLVEEKQRARMSQRARELVDGKGVLNTLRKLGRYRLSVGESI